MIEVYTWSLKNYVAFSGRTKRSEFWLFVLAQSLILVVGLVLASIHGAVGMLLTVYLLGTLIPTLAATVRRLHDTSRGFWWLPLGVCLAPVAVVLGAVGVLFMGKGLLGWIFSSVVPSVVQCLEFFFWRVERDVQGTAVVTDNFFMLVMLGLALVGLGVIAGIAGGVLAIILLVFLVSPSTVGENKYGPQPN